MKILFATDANNRSVKEVSSVKLDSRLICIANDKPICARIKNLSRQSIASQRLIKHVVLIVTASPNQLLIFFSDPCSNPMRAKPVKRSVHNRDNSSGRDQSLGCGGVVFGRNLNQFVENRTVAFSAQIKISVVGKVDRRGLGGCCRVLNPQSV